jgi:hypothetical protein
MLFAYPNVSRKIKLYREPGLLRRLRGDLRIDRAGRGHSAAADGDPMWWGCRIPDATTHVRQCEPG